MNKEGYSITILDNETFTFYSKGKNGNILKAVIFQEIYPNIYNVALLDYNSTSNSWSDVANTNNGDMSIIMKTVISSILIFLEKNSTAEIYIEGNTKIKKLMYNRIFRNYYKEFQNNLVVMVDGTNGKEIAESDKFHDFFYLYKKSML